MKDMEQSPSTEYVERFNQGYLIAKHKPELALELSQTLENTEGFDAFRFGMDEYALEQKKNNRHNWLSPERTSENKESSPDKDKEISDKE